MLPSQPTTRLKVTVVSAIGMLVLGVTGTLLGQSLETELATCVGAASGMVLGSFVGGWVSYRCFGVTVVKGNAD